MTGLNAPNRWIFAPFSLYLRAVRHLNSGFHDAAAQAAYQVLWLPDERLRCPAHGGHAGAAKALSRPPAPTMPTSSSSTPATSARRLPKKSIPNSAGCASPRTRPRATAAAMNIAVAGCVAQAEGKEIIRRAPVVDVVVGPQSYHHLPQLLRARQTRRPRAGDRISGRGQFGFLPQPKPDAIRARGISSFVTVQEGCDKFCTFCVVPYTRGAEVSRPVAKIVDDVKRLADNGVREITLIGQNVNAYHGEGPDGQSWPLGKLLRSPRRNSRHRAAALLDQPSPRCRRHADRGASRSRRADAVRASAGAVGFRPDPCRHEPQAYRRRLPRASSTVSAPRAKTLHFHRILSSASPARARKIFPPPSRWSRKSATLAPIRSNIRRGRERRRRTCRRRCQRQRWTSDWCGFRN